MGQGHRAGWVVGSRKHESPSPVLPPLLCPALLCFLPMRVLGFADRTLVALTSPMLVLRVSRVHSLVSCSCTAALRAREPVMRAIWAVLVVTAELVALGPLKEVAAWLLSWPYLCSQLQTLQLPPVPCPPRRGCQEPGHYPPLPTAASSWPSPVLPLGEPKPGLPEARWPHCRSPCTAHAGPEKGPRVQYQEMGWGTWTECLQAE